MASFSAPLAPPSLPVRFELGLLVSMIAARKPHETLRPATAFHEAKLAAVAKAKTVFVVDDRPASVHAARTETVRDGNPSSRARVSAKTVQSALPVEWAAITDTEMIVGLRSVTTTMEPKIGGATSMLRARKEIHLAEMA